MGVLKGDVTNDEFDCVVVIAIKASNGYLQGVSNYYPECLPHLVELREADDHFDKDTSFIHLPAGVKIRSLIYSPVGPVNRDYDDVRRFAEAASRGAKRAIKAGYSRPLVIIPTPMPHNSPLYPFYDVATLLGVYEAIYTPLELRECLQASSSSCLKLSQVTFCNFVSEQRAKDALRLAEAIERGRNVCRDIGGSDPERMSTLHVVSHVESLFPPSASSVVVEVISDPNVIKREFPCLSIVDRGSPDRHRARIIFLSYEPPGNGPIDQTLVLVGKGVTYDTGGADVKAGGIMAGMHRDKCGAAAVAGFFQTLDILKPKGLRVFGAMPMVRNSIGSDCYVADELVTSRSGVRVRVGNTDAEGRMEMVDCLTFFKEKILKEAHPNPQFFSIATLTGHACLAAGEYSIIMDNGPARHLEVSKEIAKTGEKIGDLFEISTIRREDYDFNKGKSEYEDILQCNNLPSSRTPRGHQIPAAFLLQVSGLDKHGLDSKQPIPFSHIDIAASSGPFPGIPSGSPVPALALHYLLSRDCNV